MGLKTVIENAVVTAFNVIEDLLQDVVYVSTSSTGYDTATGQIVETYEMKRTIAIVVEEYNEAQIDGENIRKNDRKIMVPKLKLDFRPKNEDEVFIDQVKWGVVDIKTDPAEAAWVMQIRQ